jgi:predicted MFS family arabinose efflux permease
MFWSARTISFAGTGITVVVLPVLVYRLTRSPAAVASLSAIETIPYLALGLFAGALADRLDRRRIMVACDTAAALLLGSVPVAAALQLLAPAQVFVVAVGIAAAFVWFDAANFGALPALVTRGQLPEAASAIGSSGTIALIVGPTLGAALLSVAAPSYILGLDALTYVVSAVLLASIRRPFRRPEQQPDRRQRVRADIAEGLRFLWHHPVIRTLTLSVFCICVSWGGAFGLLVVYATHALRLPSAGPRLGLLYSAGEIGGLISVVVVPKIVRRPRIGRLTSAMLAANAAALALLSIAPGYAVALPQFCCFEFTYVMVITTSITVRQMLTPDRLQGRVNTAGRLIAWGGQPVGALLAGLLAEMLSIRLVFGLLTISVAVGAGIAGWSCRRSGPLSVISVSPPGE